MTVPYQRAGLALSQAGPNDPALVRVLQQDLRSLGYLLRGIDGQFGPGTTRAVRALQWDLLRNDGASKADPGTTRFVNVDGGTTNNEPLDAVCTAAPFRLGSWWKGAIASSNLWAGWRGYLRAVLRDRALNAIQDALHRQHLV